MKMPVFQAPIGRKSIVLYPNDVFSRDSFSLYSRE